jgi:hypothetical protein
VGVSAVAQIVAPKFSKTHAFLEMRRMFVGTIALVGLLAVAVILAALFFPTQLLWLLGPKYEHLHASLFLAALLAMLQVAKAVVMRLNQAKAWIFTTSAWNIPFTLAAVVLGYLLFDTNTLNGVLGLMLLSLIPMLILYLIDARRGFGVAYGKETRANL